MGQSVIVHDFFLLLPASSLSHFLICFFLFPFFSEPPVLTISSSARRIAITNNHQQQASLLPSRDTSSPSFFLTMSDCHLLTGVVVGDGWDKSLSQSLPCSLGFKTPKVIHPFNIKFNFNLLNFNSKF